MGHDRPLAASLSELVRKEQEMKRLLISKVHLLTALGLLLLLGAVSPAALAQQPSQEQIAAIKQSCRSDYIEHCSSVPTGGAASLNCLKQNEAQLGQACRQAVAAIGEGTAAAAPHSVPAAGSGATAHGDAMEIFREECGADVRRVCRGVFPGGGRVIGCLAENREQLSPACRTAMIELRDRR
jgi:hypothetical protein